MLQFLATFEILLSGLSTTRKHHKSFSCNFFGSTCFFHLSFLLQRGRLLCSHCHLRLQPSDSKKFTAWVVLDLVGMFDCICYLLVVLILLTVTAGVNDGTCHLHTEVNNASMFLSARLPDTAPSTALSLSCGSDVGRAWTVSVNAGQLINFTLIDLTPSQSRHHLCLVSVVLVERAEEHVQLCTGQQHNLTYMSTGSVVNVTLYHQLNRNVNYLLKYEGKPIGTRW